MLKYFLRISPKFNQVENMIRGLYLPSFVAIGWAVLPLLWGQCKLRSASVPKWPWPKVTEMGAKKISHTHRSTMCGFKKSASVIFPENWKVMAERRRRRRKRTKNNMCPGYPGWPKFHHTLKSWKTPEISSSCGQYRGPFWQLWRNVIVL